MCAPLFRLLDLAAAPAPFYIFLRGFSEALLKNAGEIIVVGKTGTLCDEPQRHCSAIHQLPCPGKTIIRKILDESLTGFGFKDPAQVGRAVMDGLRDA